MTFFSLLCALLLEQLYPLPESNPVWRAQQRLADWSIRNLNAGKPVHGWICWAAAVAAPALLAYFALIGAVGLVTDGNYLRRPRRSIRLR